MLTKTFLCDGATIEASCESAAAATFARLRAFNLFAEAGLVLSVAHEGSNVYRAVVSRGDRVVWHTRLVIQTPGETSNHVASHRRERQS